MSYILDALRKSERQRRLGQPPDLDAAPSTDESDRPQRSGRLKWAAGAALLVLLATVGGIYWYIEQRAPVAFDQPLVGEQVVPPPAQSPPAPPDEPTAEAAGADAGADQAQDTEEAGQRRTRSVADRRSPSHQRPVTSVSRPAPARPGAVATPPPVVPEGERERLVADAETARRLIEERSATAARQTTAPSRTSDRAGESESNPALETEPGWEPDRAEYVEVWELPLAIRRELPELHLSIHVFSAEPAERFVLINGERRREGDSLGEGARLTEISRRGAVVDFRDYRFLLQP
ncbi:MAG: general secretion pathway protein GspB [Wenzhouxiangella sp.]|nr:general secretion pathway protein GspB [Wenzhouxiangella sp.]